MSVCEVWAALFPVTWKLQCVAVCVCVCAVEDMTAQASVSDKHFFCQCWKQPLEPTTPPAEASVQYSLYQEPFSSTRLLSAAFICCLWASLLCNCSSFVPSLWLCVYADICLWRESCMKQIDVQKKQNLCRASGNARRSAWWQVESTWQNICSFLFVFICLCSSLQFCLVPLPSHLQRKSLHLSFPFNPHFRGKTIKNMSGLQ